MIPAHTSRKDLVIQISINEHHPKSCVGVSADLDPTIRHDLLSFLKEKTSKFAWSILDMKGINIKVTSHELHIDPTFKPITQIGASSVPTKLELWTKK